MPTNALCRPCRHTLALTLAFTFGLCGCSSGEGAGAPGASGSSRAQTTTGELPSARPSAASPDSATTPRQVPPSAGTGTSFTAHKLTGPAGAPWPRAFDVAITKGRAWITAQTTVRGATGGSSDNGPLVVWERGADASFRVVETPATTIAYYPELCTVGADEIYILLEDGREQRPRIFALAPSGAFVEEPAPTPPAGRWFPSLRLRCFAGGELWVYGSAQGGDDVGDQKAALFHRPKHADPWVALAVPPKAGPIRSALVRRDGTGAFAFTRRGGGTELFERSATGAFRAVPGFETERDVAPAASDPDGSAIIGLFGPSASFWWLDAGHWSSITPAEPFALRATALGAGGRWLLGGGRSARGASEAVLYALPHHAASPGGGAPALTLVAAGAAGQIERVVLDESGTRGLAVLSADAEKAEVGVLAGLYDLTL